MARIRAERVLMSTLLTYYQRILERMGSEFVQDSTARLPLWQRYADQFPVREHLTYLNHAAVAPLAKPAADAMKRLADDCLAFGSLHYGEWLGGRRGPGGGGGRVGGGGRG